MMAARRFPGIQLALAGKNGSFEAVECVSRAAVGERAMKRENDGDLEEEGESWAGILDSAGQAEGGGDQEN